MTFSHYIKNIPDNRKARFEAIHSLILTLYPKVTISMKYKMPTYELASSWIAIANQKQYLSIYTCNAEYIALFKEKYPTIKTGKGCINLKDKDDFNLLDLSTVVHLALNH